MKDSPDLKIGATLLKFGRGANASYQARLGVLHADASTAAQAKAALGENIAAVLSDPADLLRVALEAAALNDVDVAAVAAERGFRLAPVEVHAGEARIDREVVRAERCVIEPKDLADGMLIACEWRGGLGRAAPMLALVQQRTPHCVGAAPSLFVEWVHWLDRPDDLMIWPAWWRPGEWSGEWLGRDARLGEIEVLASGLPRSVPAAEVRRLAELAGWPGRFVGVEAELRRLVHHMTGEHLDDRRDAQIVAAVHKARAVKDDFMRALQILDEYDPADPIASLVARLWEARSMASRLKAREAGSVEVSAETLTTLRLLKIDEAAVRDAAMEAEPDGVRRAAAIRAVLALMNPKGT